MKSVVLCAAWMGVAVFAAGEPLLAQLRDNSEKQLSCQNGGYDSDGVRHCEMREQSAASIGRLNVDASRNGGLTVKGWLRSEVLVRARVEASAENEGAAASLAGRVSIDSSGGQVRAIGPELGDNSRSGWSVTYEIFVPQNTDLTATARNGGITISDVRGQIRFEGRNGGVNLKRVAGDVVGSTANGGVKVELTGNIWDGRQLEVTTKNGGVDVTMPAAYSAHIQAESERGGFQSDFPVSVQGNVQSEARPRRLEFNVGAGGPLIHVTTTNGRVSFNRAD